MKFFRYTYRVLCFLLRVIFGLCRFTFSKILCMLCFLKSKLCLLMCKLVSKRNAVSEVERLRNKNTGRFFKVKLVFCDKNQECSKTSLPSKGLRGFSPRNLFEKIFSADKGSELRSFAFSQIRALTIPENANQEQTASWGRAISDFLFEISLLSKNGQLAEATRNEVFNALESEMKFRQMELVDSDEYVPALHKVVSSIPWAGAGKITVKEKASYGIKIRGVIFKKQEVVIYNPSFSH